MALFIDNEVREQGFNSTLDYIEAEITGKTSDIAFHNPKYFYSLLQNRILQAGMFIRTSDGRIDGHYRITKDGKLEGVTCGPYPGKPGIFKAEEVLTPDLEMWTIHCTSRFELLFEAFKKMHSESNSR